MSLDDLIGAQRVGPEDESGRKSVEGQPPDLGGLLGGLLGGGAGAMGGPGAAGLDVNGLAEQAGIAPSIMQAVIPFVIGALLKGGQQRVAGIDLGAAGPEGTQAHGVAAMGGGAPLAELLGRLIGGQSIDSQFLHSTGLPQELARRTGLDLPKALAAIQHVLEALRGRVSPSHGASTHPAEHPSGTHASGTTNPRPATSALSPKPGAGTIKPRPGASAPKRKPGGGASGPKPPHGTSKPRPGGSGSGGRSKVPGG